MPSATQSRPNHKTHLCSSDSTTLTSTTLSRAQVSLLPTNNRLGLLYNLLTLSQDQFDVARVGHVWVDLDILSVNSPAVPVSEGSLHDRGHGMFVDVA
jgi:hypothetical protein